MWKVGGTYEPGKDTGKKEESQSAFNFQYFTSMWLDGFSYIKTSTFGPMVFMKASGSVIWGAYDVLNVSFSQIEGDPEQSSERLGTLFFFAGLGSISAAVASDFLGDMRRVESLQLWCIASIGIISIACLGMGYFISFYAICVISTIRSFGSSLLWIYSSLILQVESHFHFSHYFIINSVITGGRG